MATVEKIDLGWTACNINTKRLSRRRALYTCKCGKQWEAPYYQRKGLDHKPVCSSCAKIKHNRSKTKLYKNYYGMLQRCYNQKAKHFKHYGGRGITVCDEWKNDFFAFSKWALSNGYRDGLSIERIDNNGNYEPSNCKYIPIEQQYLNQRARKDNETGFIGVVYAIDRKKYRSRVLVDKKTIWLGQFETPLEAAMEREEFIILNKLPHHRNFIKVAS